VALGIKLLNCSIVLAARTHNPSIINPDFLERTGIVLPEWGLKVAPDPISTPPLSQVAYEGGIRLFCDPGKVQIIDDRNDITPETSKVMAIAAAYVSVLPHVPYTAVGINFTASYERSDARARLTDQFLKAGPWCDELDSIGLRLHYHVTSALLRLSLEVADVVDAGIENETETKPAIIADANYHHERGESSDNSAIEAAINSFPQRWHDFQARLDRVILSKESIP
jgi:hypothetical protein